MRESDRIHAAAIDLGSGLVTLDGAAHDRINNLFHLRRDHVSAVQYRAARAQAFEMWAAISGVADAA